MEDKCKLPYNPDLYGIGIRIGLYCQWLTSLIGQAYVPTEAPAIQAATQLFQTAILISLVVLTAKKKVYQPEILVILPLCFGGFLTSQHLPSLTSGRGSIPRRVLAVLNFGALVIYSCWFWISGASQLQKQHQDCAYGTLIFRRWDIMTLRTFGIVASAIGCSVFLITLALHIRRVSAVVAEDGLKSSLLYMIPVPVSRAISPDPRPRWQTWLQIVVALLAHIHLAAMVELTLIWNFHDSETILSAGQMIPLVIGASGLVKVIYMLLTSQIRERRVIPH